jgi:hypothetical protein
MDNQGQGIKRKREGGDDHPEEDVDMKEGL